MELRNLFSRSGDLTPGDTVEAIYEGKGKRAGGRIVVTYTEYSTALKRADNQAAGKGAA